MPGALFGRRVFLAQERAHLRRQHQGAIISLPEIDERNGGLFREVFLDEVASVGIYLQLVFAYSTAVVVSTLPGT